MKRERVILVGQAPSRNRDPKRPLIGGKSGYFLQQLCGMTLLQYVRRFETVNLLSSYPGGSSNGDRFPMKQARISAALFAEGWAGRRAIFLGQKVAQAFDRQVVPFFEWTADARGFRFAVMPHPSGVNRFWNRSENHAKARAFLAEFAVKPAVQKENEDGKGKARISG